MEKIEQAVLSSREATGYGPYGPYPVCGYSKRNWHLSRGGRTLLPGCFEHNRGREEIGKFRSSQPLFFCVFYRCAGYASAGSSRLSI